MAKPEQALRDCLTGIVKKEFSPQVEVHGAKYPVQRYSFSLVTDHIDVPPLALRAGLKSLMKAGGFTYCDDKKFFLDARYIDRGIPLLGREFLIAATRQWGAPSMVDIFVAKDRDISVLHTATTETINAAVTKAAKHLQLSYSG